MSEQSSKKGMMAKDTVIYMLAKGFEGVVGILTLSIMTWLFLPEKMGQYSNVNIAVTTAAMFAIQWLVQSVLRYINKYDIENEQEKFFTTVFTAWLKVNIIVIFFGIIALIIINSGVFRRVYPDGYVFRASYVYYLQYRPAYDFYARRCQRGENKSFYIGVLGNGENSSYLYSRHEFWEKDRMDFFKLRCL